MSRFKHSNDMGLLILRRTPASVVHTWSLHDSQQNGVITQNNGVIDPCLKGHGDSRYPFWECVDGEPVEARRCWCPKHSSATVDVW